MELLSDWLEWSPRLLSGLWVSVQVTALSLLVGIPLGLGLALLSSVKSRVVRILTMIFIEVGRGMPAIVMLQMVYFGLPEFNIVLDSFTATVVALSLTTSAYTSEIIRAGLRAVPDGEIEAADALGIKRLDVMRFIVVPQGFRIALPTLMGFAILILQVSSLAFTLGLPELLSQAYSVGASTFHYLEVLTLAGLMYLVITVPGGWLVENFEKRLSRHLS
ncbi:amino acid ABC transporter permease [Homoserinimonas hongtaonis]|uniref:Amino acid ABC transporter permease n=1 Tax=Homoserinimonas hongtaonis TaxID=2079791 RepID=A0A2U1SXY5_9MICO|nr:amino acid ABC transporter permease [Salinibacterium hongtaonis]AWB89045.1 amino acid ABC transporter permease [Salinibacterium hongtaonis]PWB96495.1 amino acid ABC transporter permease [Salinibacterium hongtaonis]